MLKENELYDPELYRKGGRPPAHCEASVEEAVYILQRQGGSTYCIDFKHNFIFARFQGA